LTNWSRIDPDHKVSNPCASGRCSSDPRGQMGGVAVAVFQTPAPRGGVPLKVNRRNGRLGSGLVSNPCASGRCSSAAVNCLFAVGDLKFQTPAPRGGVPLGCQCQRAGGGQPGFKPLRLGAVFLCF